MIAISACIRNFLVNTLASIIKLASVLTDELLGDSIFEGEKEVNTDVFCAWSNLLEVKLDLLC